MTPRGGHSLEPPVTLLPSSQAFLQALGEKKLSGYRGVEPIPERELPVVKRQRRDGDTGLERQQPPLIFQWLLDKTAQSRIIGSLSAPR